MVIDADLDLLGQLEPVAEQLLENHIEKTKEWHPHTFVPWSRGEDFPSDYEWSPEEFPLPDEVRSALFVNILTEDNLPYYFRDIERMFGRDGAWGEWVRRWTAEEGRHAVAIRDYLTITRAIDPVALERARMVQMSTGEVPEPETATDGMVYVTLQELATRISHRNTGALVDDPAGYDIMRRVAMDENHHFLFYRDITKAALDLNPSMVVQSMEKHILNFDMPGTGIPNFEEHSKKIAKAGIYDLHVHHEQIIEPIVLNFWDLPNIEGLDAEAEQSRERTMAFIEKSGRVANRLKDRKERQAAAEEVSLTD